MLQNKVIDVVDNQIELPAVPTAAVYIVEELNRHHWSAALMKQGFYYSNDGGRRSDFRQLDGTTTTITIFTDERSPRDPKLVHVTMLAEDICLSLKLGMVKPEYPADCSQNFEVLVLGLGQDSVNPLPRAVRELFELDRALFDQI